jgi:hypothetical protein
VYRRLVRTGVIATAAVLLATSCSEEDTAPLEPVELRESLRQVEESSTQMVDSLVQLYDAYSALKLALESESWDQAGVIIDKLPERVDAFDVALTDLVAAETRVQQLLRNSPAPPAGTSRVMAEPAPAATLPGLRKGSGYIDTLRRINEEVSKARRDRDDAVEDLASGVEGASERIKDSQDRMNTGGSNVLGVVGTTISSTLVMAPFKPITMGGAVFKAGAKAGYEKGLHVISTTGTCADPAASDGCLISVERTDDRGAVKLPVGKNAIMVSGNGKARVHVDQVEIVEGAETTVEQPQVPIAEASPDNVTVGDEAPGNPVEPSELLPCEQAWMLCERSEPTGTDGHTNFLICLEVEGGKAAFMDTDGQAGHDACEVAGYEWTSPYYCDEKYPGIENPEYYCKDWCVEMASGLNTECRSPP